jgi:hypothetical protein
MAIVTFQQGVNNYTSALDTVLKQGSPSTAFGTTISIGPDGDASKEIQTLIAFDSLFGSGAGQIPLGATITSASLTLQTTNGSGNGGALYRMLSDWGNGSTWNSLGSGIQTDGTEAVATPDVTVGSVAIGSRDFDVTTSLQAWAAAGTTTEAHNAANQGWLFETSSTDGWFVDSSEGATKPLLSVTYTLDGPPPLAGVTVTQSGGSTAVTEGGTTDTFTVALASAPSANVTISIAGDADVTGSPTSLTFTPANWQSPQTVTVTAEDDTTVEGTETATVNLTASSADASYNNFTIAPVTVTVTDNDTAPPPPSGSTTVTFREGVNGYTGTLDTMLKQASPTAGSGTATTLRVDAGTGVEVQTLLGFDNLFGPGPGQIPLGATITSATLTLQTTNGSNNGGSLYRMLSDWNNASTWNSLTNGVQIDGSEAVAIADATVGVATTGSSKVVDVTKSLQAWASAGTTAEAHNAANQGWLFKTPSTDAWDFDSSEATTRPLLSVTYTLDGTPPPPAAGVTVTQSGGSTAVTEGGATDTFTVALTSAPTANVTITISGNADVTGAPTPLTFTPANWQTAQTVTVTAVNDTTVENTETAIVSLTSASTDSRYNSLSIPSVSVTVTDNDNETAPPPITARIVKVTDLTSAPYKSADAKGYGVGDPSGLAYVPGLQKLFIADSEHDESPYLSSSTLFSLGPNGAVQAYSLTSFTKEPTGLAYNPNNGHLYITDDDKQEVFWVDPANPSKMLGSFDTASLGFLDSEDPKFDPVTGHMFMLDGSLKKIFELTDQGVLVGSTALPSVMSDAEALAYDPTHEVFFVASGKSPNIWELDRNGNILATINVLGSSSPKPIPKGLELAPSSDPTDGNKMSLYVADYGVDQRNDGRLFEIDLGSGWLIA